MLTVNHTTMSRTTQKQRLPQQQSEHQIQHQHRSASGQSLQRGQRVSAASNQHQQEQRLAILQAFVSELSFWEPQPSKLCRTEQSCSQLLSESTKSNGVANTNHSSQSRRLKAQPHLTPDAMMPSSSSALIRSGQQRQEQEYGSQMTQERDTASNVRNSQHSSSSRRHNGTSDLAYSDSEDLSTSSATSSQKRDKKITAALIAAAASWKTAVDPVSGRTYYYDSVTRKTQWEKPEEVKALEQKKREDKRREDLAFFVEMQQNIMASLARGDLIPGISRQDTVKQGPPKEPLNVQQVHNTKNIRIRTISGMNEQLLIELQKDNGAPMSFLQNQNQNHTKLPPSQSSQQQRPPAITMSSRTGSGGIAVEGRPPLPFSRRVSTNSNVHPLDSLEFSPEQSLSTVSSSNSIVTTTNTVSEQDAFAMLRGEAFLDGPILLEDDPAYAGIVVATTLQSATPQQPNSDVVTSTTILLTKPVGKNKPETKSSNTTCTNHVRRNTGGTMYVKSTMENPDINAMIKCVCGVYRAHIIQSVTRKCTNQRSPVSVQTALINLDIFKDDFEVLFRRDNKDPPIPSLADIELFYHDFYARSQMEHDTIIMSLIYVERLIKETNGALTPEPGNWRSVLFSCMVLSSKVWDDLSMFNLDFSNVSIASGLSAFSLKRTNALELAVLTSLNFNVRVPASEYAKYYFLIRTMLTRSGLLMESNNKSSSSSSLAMSNDGGQRLESRTNHYQNSKLWELQLQQTQQQARNGNKSASTMNMHERRTRSVDWSFFGKEADPVLRDNLCLEQLVSSDH